MQSLQICNISQEPEEQLFFNFRAVDLKEDNLAQYAMYSSGSSGTLSERQLLEMEVLDNLFRLGFPHNEEGTYLYKDMIMKAIHHLDGFDDLGQPMTEDELLAQMQAKYSQFYLDVARNDLDIGIKTFHTYINHALSSVDYACVDPNILSEIYGDFSEEADYGTHAFVIAKNMYTQRKTNEKNPTAIQYVKTSAPAKVDD